MWQQHIIVSSLGVRGREGKFRQITNLNCSNPETAPLIFPIFFYKVSIIFLYCIFVFKKSVEDFRRIVVKRCFNKTYIEVYVLKAETFQI